jgi:acyl dehydratase
VGYDAVVPPSLAPYRVTARNTSVHSANKIHDDTVARRYGFRGGLVPGVTVYGYMTRAILGALGRAWIERGDAAVRFTKPIYEGEEIALRASPRPGSPAGVEVHAVNPAGESCAIATAAIPGAGGEPIDLAQFPVRPLPGTRPEAARAVLEALGPLGSPERRYDAATAAECRERFDDADPIYAGAGALVHPAFFLDQANRALDQNLALGPWIHAASEVRHLRAGRVGERITTRGRVLRVFEKKGNEFVELDLLLVADGVRPVARVRHLAIYRVREPVA